MIITATIADGRCFFNTFNKENDKDPKTGKAGVNFCRFQFIGIIFACLGLAYRIHTRKNGELYNCYVYTKEIKSWMRRHEKDPTFVVADEINCLVKGRNQELVIDKAKKLSSFIIEKYIDAVSRNHQHNQEVLASRQINPGTPLSYEKVLERAEEEFAEDEDKEDILKIIRRELNWRYELNGEERRPYKERLKEGLPPYFGEAPQQENSIVRRPGDGRYELYMQRQRVAGLAIAFLNSLPGVDATPFFQIQ